MNKFINCRKLAAGGCEEELLYRVNVYAVIKVHKERYNMQTE